MTTATKSRLAPIYAKSDIPFRLFSFFVITPIFLMTGYRWLVESIIQDELTLSDLGWVAMNCSGLVVLILGSVFMRGHNNRNILIVEAFMPVAFWTIYLKAGTLLTQSGYFYAAVCLGPVLYAIAIAFLITRMRVETKLMFMLGKYVAPVVAFLAGYLPFLRNKANAIKSHLQDYAINAVASKGTTNFQLYMLTLYLINGVLWGVFAIYYMFIGIINEVPFKYMPGSPEERISEMALRFWDFDLINFLTADAYDFVNLIWAFGMIYYILTDYVSPDEIGRNKRGVANHVGHGAKPLIL